MKYLPQIEGTIKPLLTIFFGSLAIGLWQANQHNELNSWAMLPEALYDGSFTAFMAIVAWLALRSPISASSLQEKAVTKAVEQVGTKATESAKATVAAMQEASTQAVVEQLGTVEPPNSGAAIAVVVPPKPKE